MEVAGRSHIRIDLHCGRNALVKSKLTLASSEAIFDIKAAKLMDEVKASVEFSNEDIAIVEADSGTILFIEAPHSVSAGLRQMVRLSPTCLHHKSGSRTHKPCRKLKLYWNTRRFKNLASAGGLPR